MVLDLPATLRARLLRGGGDLRHDDLQRKLFRHRQQTLVVFVVDTSESMGEGTLERMKAAKGAILGLLTAAYQNRDQVALVTFRDQRAEVLLRPTSSIHLARERLRRLALGGATPLAAGLWEAWQLIRTERNRQPGVQPWLVLVSDGEANVPLVTGAEVLPELYGLARRICRERIAAEVIDSRLGAFGSESLKILAGCLKGGYRHVRDLHAGKLLEAVRASVGPGRRDGN